MSVAPPYVAAPGGASSGRIVINRGSWGGGCRPGNPSRVMCGCPSEALKLGYVVAYYLHCPALALTATRLSFCA